MPPDKMRCFMKKTIKKILGFIIFAYGLLDLFLGIKKLSNIKHTATFGYSGGNPSSAIGIIIVSLLICIGGAYMIVTAFKNPQPKRPNEYSKPLYVLLAFVCPCGSIICFYLAWKYKYQKERSNFLLKLALADFLLIVFASFLLL